jgi:hypothetical protein
MRRLVIEYDPGDVPLEECGDCPMLDVDGTLEDFYWCKVTGEKLHAVSDGPANRHPACLANEDRWIPVEERLPAIHEVVLVWNTEWNNEDTRPALAFLSESDTWHAVEQCLQLETPTHWRELPQGPG